MKILKNKKNFCFFIAMLFNYSIVNAQESYLIKLSTNDAPFNDGSFYIDSIVDNRFNKSDIGVVMRGLDYTQHPANLKGGFNNALENYFKVNFPKKNNQAQRIIPVIIQFYIGEKAGKFKEVGTANVEIIFCKLDSGRLSKLFETSSKIENSGLKDVTAGHEKRIKKAIRQCLENFIASDWKNGRPQPLNSSQGIITKENHILTAPIRKKGVYINFLQLISNNPSIVTSYITSRKGDIVTIKDSITDNKLKDVYGYCDGKDIFINTGMYANISSGKKGFARVIEEGTLMAWMDHYVSPVEGGIAYGTFGVLGNALASRGLDVMVLDLRTGLITVASENSMKKLLKEDLECYTEYYYLKEEKSDKKVQLRLIKKFNERNKIFK